MIKLSEASHPIHREKTLRAALATLVDNGKIGPNPLPEILDDVKTGKVVTLASIRSTISSMNLYLSRQVAIRTENGKVFLVLSKGY